MPLSMASGMGLNPLMDPSKEWQWGSGLVVKRGVMGQGKAYRPETVGVGVTSL